MDLRNLHRQKWVYVRGTHITGVDEAKSKQQYYIMGERVFVNILFRWSWTHRYISAWAIDAWNSL